LKGVLNIQIERIDDRVFLVSISEKEAQRLADGTEIDFSTSKMMSSHIGVALLHYMIESSMFPHDKRPPIELDL